MKPHHFTALAVAAAVSLVAALLAYSAQMQRSSATPAGALLFPQLADTAKSVEAIEIAQGAKTLTLERKGDIWNIKEKGGFQASQEKVRALLVSLTEAELAEAKTRSKERYPFLELEDPKGENANSYLVRLLGAGGKPVAEVIIGKKRYEAFGSGRAGNYVRRPGEDQTWLITRELDPGLDIKSWVRARLFEMRPETIKSASITTAGDPAYDITRDADGKTFNLAKIPEGKKIRYMNAVDDIVDTLSSFNIEEVRKAGATSGANIAKLTTDQGLSIELRAEKDGEFAWMSVKAEGEGEAKAAAEDLKTLGEGWEFRIPAAQFDRIFKKETELLEDKTS